MADYDQHQLENDFRQACSLGNLNEVIRNITEKVVDINVADKYEQFTGLHMAAEHNHYEILEYLLKNNANVNCQNGLGETPIIIALKFDAKSKSKIDFTKINKMIDLLIEYGADLTLGYSKDIDSKSMPKAIHCAVILGDINIIRKLCNKNPALIVSKDSMGRYPMHYAAKYNKIFAMQELLTFDAELEPKDNDGWTPFHVACDFKNLDAVQFILDQGGHMHTKTNNGDQALHIAVRHKIKEIVPIIEFLINQGADQQSRDSKGKCLKDYIKENILLKNVISNAKKKRSKYANASHWGQKDSKGGSPSYSADSFGILDLKGERLYTSSGYKIDESNKGKKLDGSISLYEHGLLFSFKKGFITKSTVEEFHPWKPYVDIQTDLDNAKLLKIEFPHSANSEVEEKESDTVGTDKFGIVPCRTNEITETIQNEIDKMYPTYSLQTEIKKFIQRIGDPKQLVAEYDEIWNNVRTSTTESNEIKMKLMENADDNALNGKFDQLQSEINTMNARLLDIRNDLNLVWNECEGMINKKIEPLIKELCSKIDAMIVANEHWKIISNVRKSLGFAKTYKKKLIDIRTDIRVIVNGSSENDANVDNISYSAV